MTVSSGRRGNCIMVIRPDWVIMDTGLGRKKHTIPYPRMPGGDNVATALHWPTPPSFTHPSYTSFYPSCVVLREC